MVEIVYQTDCSFYIILLFYEKVIFVYFYCLYCTLA